MVYSLVSKSSVCSYTEDSDDDIDFIIELCKHPYNSVTQK